MIAYLAEFAAEEFHPSMQNLGRARWPAFLIRVHPGPFG
jgi:hypothetical protein